MVYIQTKQDFDNQPHCDTKYFSQHNQICYTNLYSNFKQNP
jgi:hypothetical protein